MNLFELLRVVVFALPMSLFVVWGLYLLTVSLLKTKMLDVLLKRILVAYCSISAVSGIMFFIYYCLPEYFSSLDLLYFLPLIITPILFYHFLFFAIKPNEHFKRLHYVIALFICLGLILFKWKFPALWRDYGEKTSLGIGLLLGIIYSLLPLYYLYDYSLKQVVESKKKKYISKTNMILFIEEVFAYAIIMCLVPLVTGHNPSLFATLLIMAALVFTLRMSIPLLYGMIVHYTSFSKEESLFSINDTTSIPSVPFVVQTNTSELEDPMPDEAQEHQPKKIDRDSFEMYMARTKPHLNSKITIQDIADELRSNRSYLSHYIKQTYGMSFSHFINLCRILEMENLLSKPKNTKKTPYNLFPKTGFGSYRSYLRAKTLINHEKAVSIQKIFK